MRVLENSIFTQDFIIKPQEADLKHDILPSHLMWILQEAGVNQIEILQIGFDYLVEKKVTWALAGFEFDVKRAPKWKEKVTVFTWHKKKTGLFSYRDFEIKDSAGNILVVATSSWFIMDLENRRPARAEEYIPKLEESSKCALDSKLRRGSIGQIHPECLPVYTSTQKVKFLDLDHNGHANNVHYIRWMFNSLPTPFRMDFLLAHFEIFFTKEVNCDQTILEKTWECEKMNDDFVFIHHLYHEDGSIAAISRSRWKKREELQ